MIDLLLETSQWDLIPTQDGDIATCSTPYAVAQGVANEIKLFQGEAYYAPDQGLPYDPSIFGQGTSIPYIASLQEDAALGVPNVVSAEANIYLSGRELRGAILVTTDTGVNLNVSV